MGSFAAAMPPNCCLPSGITCPGFHRDYSSALRRVNVYKDKVKNAGNLPPLPQQAALHDALAGTYAELR